MDNLLIKQRILPVLTLETLTEAVFIAEVLLQHGINTLEITLRTPSALTIIRDLIQQFPGMHIGVGTVLHVSQLLQAKEAGAAFAVSPGFSPSLVAEAARLHLSYMPGIATVSEAMQAYEAGLTLLKFYPAVLSGGVSYLQQFQSIMPELRFCPTGGITPQNFSEFLMLKNVIAIGSSQIATKEILRDQNKALLTHHLTQFGLA